MANGSEILNKESGKEEERTRVSEEDKNKKKRKKEKRKKAKVLNNWIQCWTRVKNVLEENGDVWIKRWVRITEPSEYDRNK